MSKIFRFEQYLEERDYFSPAGEDLMEEIVLWNSEQSINEGLFDTIKNKLSKSFLGDFSKVSAIDAIRKGNLEIEKDLVAKKYEYNDKLDALELKLAEVTRSGNRAAILATDNEIAKKRDEYRAYVKSKKIQMEKGLSLLSKAIDKNKRRKEYYEAGKAEDELNLANYEYEMAKKKSSSTKEVDRLKRSLEKARTDAESLIQRFQNSVSMPSVKSVEIEVKDLSNPVKIKKKLSSKQSSDFLELKNKTENNIDKKKEELAKSLEDLASMVEKYTKSGLSPKSSVLSDAEKKATELANQIDAEVNLLNLYNGIGNTKEEIERKIKDSSKLKSLFSQINDAVKDAKDDSSGYTKEILVLFMDPTLKNLKQAIKKIK
jgi:hypothetical protein